MSTEDVKEVVERGMDRPLCASHRTMAITAAVTTVPDWMGPVIQ